MVNSTISEAETSTAVPKMPSSVMVRCGTSRSAS
jgi:hypothetical protein